jgi:hypothetical protein
LTTVLWPEYDGKRIGTVLRQSNWTTPLGIITDQTRAGKFLTRLAHIKKPKTFNIVMHMTLPEKRVFENWFDNVCRKGFFPFRFPRVDDNTGVIKTYQFAENTEPTYVNTSGDNLEVTMVWLEAL